MTEINQHKSDANKQSSNRRSNWLQDGVIDVFDRLLERQKRPPERFERKFQEFLPEYGMRLPRAPALREMSAKRVSAISDRLYSGGRCATSPPKRASTGVDGKNKTSSLHSKHRPDAKQDTSGGANYNHDKTDSLDMTRQELNGPTENNGEEKRFDIKTSKELRLDNEKSKDQDLCFNDDRSNDKEIGFDDDKFNNEKSYDKKMLCDYKDSYSEDSLDKLKEFKDKNNETPKRRQGIKVGQAPHRCPEIKEKTKSLHSIKQNSLEKPESYDDNYSAKNSYCSLREPNSETAPISKTKLTSQRANVNEAECKSSSFSSSHSSRPDQDLALIREILGQPRLERPSDIKEKSMNRVQFKVGDKGVKSDSQTVESAQLFNAKSRRSKNIHRGEPKVSIQPLRRPKRSTKLKPTRNEYMDMLMGQLYLASLANRAPPERLIRELLRFSRGM